MKNNPLITASLVAVCVLAGIVLILAGVCEWHFRTLRKMRPEMVRAQNVQNLVNSLVPDVIEYSKQHPAIDPILQRIGAKPGAPPGAAPAPAKPPGK